MKSKYIHILKRNKQVAKEKCSMKNTNQNLPDLHLKILPQNLNFVLCVFPPLLLLPERLPGN